MNILVRVTMPQGALAARIRAAVRTGRRREGDPAVVVGLPSTSNIREAIAALSRFEEGHRDEQ